MKTYMWKSCIWAAVIAVMIAGRTAPSFAKGKSEDARSAYELLQDMIYDERYSQAYEAARQFLKDYSDSKYIEAAQFWKCYALERSSRDYVAAFDCYRGFLDAHPDGKWSGDARTEYVKLAKRLSDAGDPRGKAALERMAGSGDMGSVHPSDDRDFKLAVLYALMESGDEDVPLSTIKDVLEHSKDSELRRNAVFMLSEVDDAEANDILLTIARTDPDPDVRRHAIYAVIERADDGDDRVIGELLGIMKTEKDPDIRRHVLYAISESDRPDVTATLVDVALNDPDEDMKRAAAFALADVDDPEATVALEKIANTSTSAEARQAALYALIEREDITIVPTLKKIALGTGTDGGDADLRRVAVYALAEIDDPSVVGVLKDVVASSADPEVRKAAFYALAEHGGSEAEDALRTAALDTRDEDLARAAVYGLSDLLDDEEDVAFFMEVYRKSPFAEVRRAALYAAIDNGGDASAAALGGLLGSEKDADRRKALVWALAEIETDESVSILARTARDDPDRDVRHASVQALGAMGTPAAKKALRGLLDEH